VVPAAGVVLEALEVLAERVRSVLDEVDADEAALELVALLSGTREVLLEGFARAQREHGDEDSPAYVEAAELVESFTPLVESLETSMAHVLSAREAAASLLQVDPGFASGLATMREARTAALEALEEARDLHEVAAKEVAEFAVRRPSAPEAQDRSQESSPS
jgi:hypothetical protein